MMSGHHAYFDAAIMLCFFLLGGRYLDHRTRASARSAAQELAALEVPRALRVTARARRRSRRRSLPWAISCG
jgi:Cu2+-exporting ATPase